MLVRCSQTASSSTPKKMQTSLKQSVAAESSESPSLRRNWLRAQASIKQGGFGIRDPFSTSQQPSRPQTAAPLPFALAFGPVTTTHTHDPGVAAAETHVRRNIREDVPWRPDGWTRSVQSFNTRWGGTIVAMKKQPDEEIVVILLPLASTVRTAKTIAQATQEDHISLELHQVLGAGTWFLCFKDAKGRGGIPNPL